MKELEEALLSGEIDLAVHSMKDVPTELKDGLKIGAVLKREDPRDCFVSFNFDRIEDLPWGAKVGTSSLRRKAQLRMVRKGIEVVPIRGNVETRIKKIETQGLSGIVLAYCGIKRLGLENYVREILPMDVMIPPAGQGAIGLEIREDWEYGHLLSAANDEITETEIDLERKILKLMGGGCQLPFGVSVRREEDGFSVYAFVGDGKGDDGRKINVKFSLSERDSLPKRIVEILGPFRGPDNLDSLP